LVKVGLEIGMGLLVRPVVLEEFAERYYARHQPLGQSIGQIGRASALTFNRWHSRTARAPSSVPRHAWRSDHDGKC